MKPRFLPAAVLLSTLALVTACDGDGGADEALPPADQCTLVVLGSDYASTSVSLVTDQGERCRDSVLHSGSRAPGLVTALSGDVVLPSTPDPLGRLVLLDRYPNAVLTVATLTGDGRVAVEGQLNVGTGFEANPHDVAFVSADKGYVSRFATNKSPTPAADDFDDGGDLLIIDPSALTITGRVDLQPLAGDADGTPLDPRPDRMAIAGGLVWVGLARLSRGFDAAGEGLVVAVDPSSDAVAHAVALPGLANCGGLAPAPEEDGLWVACAGYFPDNTTQLPEQAGVAWVDLSAEDAPTATVVARGLPVGWVLAPLPGGRVIVSEFGDFQGRPDRLLLVDRSGGEPRELGVEAAAFSLTAAVAPADAGLLLVADADPARPRLRRFELVDGATLGAELDSTQPDRRVGLEPRQLRPLPRLPHGASR